ncbi:hypothetical protein T190115A13A_20126 [Tenacibaculum sp. 190524A02b]|uniref:YD repeat-containing protein n=1 Tax=Tenacibaculum vairaonense TaxID=3137860 RepID=A0ABM9PMB4_9FLAO
MGKLEHNVKLWKAKRVLQFICIMLFFKNAFSQETGTSPTFSSKQFYDNAVKKITPPDATAFHESKLNSVNNYAGSASINVPLYQINQGGVTVPIQLNYISTGVKVNSVASNVGLNWSLDAGGSVTKVIKGFEDFSVVFADAFRKKFPEEEGEISDECGTTLICQNERKVKYDDFDRAKETLKSSYIESLGWFMNTQDLSVQDFFGYETNSSNLIYTEAILNNEVSVSSGGGHIKQDTYPDLFFANAPGLSTKFTHRKDKTPFEIEYQGNQIQTTVGKSNVIPFLEVFENNELHGYIKKYFGSKPRAITCVNNIQITNNNGVKYEFNVLDANQYVTRGSSTNVGVNDPAHMTSQEITTYHLNSIEDINGDKIEFEYEAYQTATRLYSKSQTFGINKNENIYALNAPSITEVFYPQLHRLKKITFKNGTVDFVYLHGRLDVHGDKALSYVIVKNTLGQVVKKYHFKYDYFVANTNCNAPECLRLKLKSVQEQNAAGEELPPYEFFYDERQLPEFGAATVDYLGYANGVKDSYDLDRHPTAFITPPTLYYSYNKKRLSFAPFKIFGDSYKTVGKNASPSLTYTKAGTLIRIKKPTGANQYFSYELNTFSTPKVKNIVAAGLRLQEQRIVDEKGHVKLLEKYFYEDEKGYSSGVINNIPLFGDVKVHSSFVAGVKQGIQNGILDFRIYSSSKNEVKLIGGNNIGYSRVVVKNGINNGTIERKYSTVNEFPIGEPELLKGGSGVDIDDEVKRSFENGGHFPFFNNNDVQLGKLTSEKVRDAKGVIVKEKEFKYNYHVFESMQQEVEVFKSQFVNNVKEGDFSMNFYPKIFSHRNLQTITTSKSIYATGEVDSRSETVYDAIYPFVKENKTTIADNEELVVKNYYPNDVVNNSSLGHEVLSSEALTAIEQLKEKRRLGTPVQTESYKNNKLLATQRIDFKDWGNEIIAPKEVKVSKNDNSLRVGVKQSFDTNGNLVEVARDKGSHMLYIYGYNNSIPVAKIAGAKLSDIPISYITAIKNASNQDNDRTIDLVDAQGNVTNYIGNEGKLREELYKLYSLSSLAKATIAVYTYDPLVGITSMTDARKQTMYYDYDGFNRVQFIKNQEGEVLSQYCYNYKGEKKKCNEVSSGGDGSEPDEIVSTTNEVSIAFSQPKDYMIPVPAHPFYPDYTWSEIEDLGSTISNDLNRSWHPFFYFAKIKSVHPGDVVPYPVEELDANFYTLNNYFTQGKGYYKMYRKGHTLSLNDIENLKNIEDCTYVEENVKQCTPLPNQNNVESNLTFSWYIISEGKRYELVKTPEIKSVFFIPKCLDNKLGKVVCEIFRKDLRTTGRPYQTIVSHEITFSTGFKSNDNGSVCSGREANFVELRNN